MDRPIGSDRQRCWRRRAQLASYFCYRTSAAGGGAAVGRARRAQARAAGRRRADQTGGAAQCSAGTAHCGAAQQPATAAPTGRNERECAVPLRPLRPQAALHWSHHTQSIPFLDAVTLGNRWLDERSHGAGGLRQQPSGVAWQVLNAINDGDLDTLIRISMNVRGVPRIALLLCSNTICAFLFGTETRRTAHEPLVSSAAHP